MSEHPLQPYIAQGFSSGKHSEYCGQFCALEAVSKAKQLPWTDDPRIVGLPDFRKLNDTQWYSKQDRAKHLGEVCIAYWDWDNWTAQRQYNVTCQAFIEIVKQILSIALKQQVNPEWERLSNNCVTVKTLEDAISIYMQVSGSFNLQTYRNISGYFNNNIVRDLQHSLSIYSEEFYEIPRIAAKIWINAAQIAK